MKPILLVLSVFRFAESRSLLSEVLESAGHKLVQASSCEQARTLLENGLEPDLVIFESSRAGGSSELFIALQAASRSTVCLVCGPGEEQVRSKPRSSALRFSWSGPLPAAISAACSTSWEMRTQRAGAGLEHVPAPQLIRPLRRRPAGCWKNCRTADTSWPQPAPC